MIMWGVVSTGGTMAARAVSCVSGLCVCGKVCGKVADFLHSFHSLGWRCWFSQFSTKVGMLKIACCYWRKSGYQHFYTLYYY